MSEHLSPDQLERFSKYQLKGAELLMALDHIEDCADCRQKVTSPTKAELIETLFGEPDFSSDVADEDDFLPEKPRN